MGYKLEKMDLGQFNNVVSVMVVANVLCEKSVFLKCSRIVLQYHFKGLEKKRRYRWTDLM